MLQRIFQLGTQLRVPELKLEDLCEVHPNNFFLIPPQ